MKAFYAVLLGCLLLGLISIGCSGSTAQEEELTRNERQEKKNRGDKEETSDLGGALSQLGDALEGMGDALNEASAVEPVHFSDLREALPRRVRGMEEGPSNGETKGVLGIRMTTVEQTYRNEENDERIDVTLVDLGGMRNAARMGMDWINVEFDREDDFGYERTTTLEGYPAMEKCRTENEVEKCEIHLIVAERFIVDLESRNVSMRKLKGVLGDIDLRMLEKIGH